MSLSFCSDHPEPLFHNILENNCNKQPNLHIAENGMSTYKHALQLYKLFNSTNMSDDWISLNYQQNFNGRNENINIFRKSNYKVGNNLLVNRCHQLNNKINYSWFNESYNSFKIKCKKLFL